MIIEKLLGWHEHDDEQSFAKDWANKLYGGGASEVHLERECDDVQNAQGCALAWASEANQWVCTYVLKDDVQGVEGQNLEGEYYDGAVPVGGVDREGREAAGGMDQCSRSAGGSHGRQVARPGALRRLHDQILSSHRRDFH